MNKPPRVAIVTNTNAESLRALAAIAPLPPRPGMDDVAAKPEVERALGRAWRCDLSEVRLRPDSGVASWVIEAKWAHPIWHSYYLVLIHLRPVAGLPPAVITLPGATHQFFLYALEAEQSRDALIRHAVPGRHGAPCVLTPMQFAAQFICDSDEAAIARMLAEAVEPICRGDLDPDSGAFEKWRAMFGDSMVKSEFRR